MVLTKIKVYIDGSCIDNPGAGGWSAVFCLKESCSVIKGNEQQTTNNRMELTALIKALEKILKKNNSNECRFEIFSDSAYVVNAVKNGWLDNWKANSWKTAQDTDVKNKDLWESLSNLIYALSDKRINWNLIKVKGHAGNAFNEMADEVAKEQSKLANKTKKGAKTNEKKQ